LLPVTDSFPALAAVGGAQYSAVVAVAELAYRYRTPSAVRYEVGRSEVLLGTSGGGTEVGPELHPYFFTGFLAEPGPAAAGMLGCAAVARARYYTPASVIAAIVADPVVTSNGDRLRFESFSGCCGVHARLDLLPDALTGQPVRSGSTNVDFNEGMRAALGGGAVAGPLLLSVGADEVAVTTMGATVTERRVTLPERWLKGFGEVQALARGMSLVGELKEADAQRFIRGIPRNARRPLWASARWPAATSLISQPRRAARGRGVPDGGWTSGDGTWSACQVRPPDRIQFEPRRGSCTTSAWRHALGAKTARSFCAPEWCR